MRGQTVDFVTGPTSVDPTCQNHTYTVSTTNNGFTPSFSYSIEPTGAGAITGTSNSGVATFNNGWNPKPMTSNLVKVKVAVTFKKAGSADVVKNGELTNIKVKTIFDFNKMTLVGTNFSQENIVSGSTISIPCEVTSLNLEVNQPTTVDGQNVDYTWTGPFIPGGQITTNNVRTLTVPVPTNGSIGTIKVVATRIDKDCFKQEYILNYTRPAVGDPSINFTFGSPITCNGDTRLMTGSATNATSFVWSPISTGIIFTPNAATGMIKFNSTTTLTLTVDNSCVQPKTVTKVIEVGPPTISPTVNGGSLSYPNYIQNPGFMRLNTNQPGLSYNWQILNGTGNIYSSGDPSQFYAYAYPFLRVQGTATNTCGTSDATFYLYNVSSGYYRLASPNPTQSTISVEMEKELGREALVSVKLISHGRNSIERSFTAEDARRTNHFNSNNNVDFDVANLPRGTYYLMIDFKGEKKFKEIIVLN